MDYDDLDEDIQRLNVALQDVENEEEGDSEGELRVLENDEEEYYSNASRPSTSSDVTASSQPTTSICTDADESLFRFDPHTITAEACLAMNRAYQEVLLDTLRQIEMSLIENRQRQKELEENVDESNKKTDKQLNKELILLETKHVPYFRDKNGTVPRNNEDVKLKEQMNEEKQHVLPRLGWTKVQRTGLIDAIKLDALEQIIRPLLNRQEIEMEKAQKCKNKEEIEQVKARIEKLQEEIKQKQLTPADELLKNVDSEKIDFMKISNFSFNGKFSALECASMWKNVLRPGINRNKWTAEEDEELKKLATKYEMKNWNQIAKELGTNRTPFQCLQHYQQDNTSIVYNNSEWTEEEDELLKEVVETCTYGLSKIHWYQVAYYLERRSAKQCESRWKKINPKRNFGRWTKEEDSQLLNAIHTHGGVLYWPKIQEHVPTRTSTQCRERYFKGMGGFALYKPWTYEDDKQLLILHQKYGDMWTKIAEHFDRRHDHMISARYKCLMKWQDLMDQFYGQPRKLQKQLKHPAFRFGQKGMLIPKSGLSLRLGCGRGRPRKILKDQTAPFKTELALLKERGGKDAEEAFKDIEVEEEPKEEIAEEKTEEEEGRVPNKVLQDKLDVFLCRYNVLAEDYLKQMQDKLDGEIVVPRPPPMNKTHAVQMIWKKHNNLTDVVKTQIDVYLNRLQSDRDTGGDEESLTQRSLYEQIAGHVQIDNETEKRKIILAAFGGKNPSMLSVRELLNISRCMKECGRPPKNAKSFHLEPWEEDDTEEEKEEEESTSEEEVEEEKAEEEEPKPKKPRTEKQIAHSANLVEHKKKYYEVERQIERLVHMKMDPWEIYKGRGRKKQFLMYPKLVLQKYKGLEEERKLNRKSLVLLMKTLDVDARKAYLRARKGKQKISAMAFLKATEKSFLKRAKTRKQKNEIQEAAREEANVNSEISEASDFLLDLKEELNVQDEEENNDSQKDEEPVCYRYNKSLPYIPPNRSNLGGMRSLLMEHRCLIDQAGYYFSPEKLKAQLYALKQKGPNPLMGVLNAIGKTESVHKKIKRKQGKQWLDPVACQEQLEEVRTTADYQKFKARFQSIFTWPALMSTIRPPKGKPLPRILQQVVAEPKASSSNTDADNVGNDSVESDQPVVMMENLSGDTAAGCDMEAGGKEVATQCAEDADIDEDLPEEEAVEKLVDKIMAEYEKERMKKKRFLPTKKYRKFSEKKKQAFVEKERTKILKRLGLYEKMQAFKRQRKEAEQSVAMSVAAAASSTDTNTGQTENRSLDAKSSPKRMIDASTVAVETQGSVKLSSEGCQTDLNPEDIGSTEVLVNTEIEPPKKRRGRPVGAKTKCYANKSPERKSQRAVEGPVLKTEQDYAMSPPKKKINRNKKGIQYNMVRMLIPEKMSKIAAQIPDLPILNEPVQVKKEKPPKKPKVVKPKPERKRVVKSKFGIAKGENRTRGPKTERILKQFKEAESKAAAAETETETVQIKTEPNDSEEMEDEDSGVHTGFHYNVVITDSVDTEMEQTPDKMMTSGVRENIKDLKEMMTGPENKAATVASLSDTRLDEKQEQKVNNTSENDINGLEDGRTHLSNASSGDVTTGHSVNTPENNKMLSQDDSQMDIQPLWDSIEGRKPYLIAVPVMIGNTQQVAMIPFYPDKDGKITLPNGKRIDPTESQGAGSASLPGAGSVSLPMINFNQPVQVIDPGKQNVQN